MPEQITFYANKGCPWAHRTEITLRESKLPYKRVEIDLENKPDWYVSKVNPAGKVPAIAYGGPEDVDPQNPSPLSHKLVESGVLLEFIADLSQNSPVPLLPKDPVSRAKARFFIETVTPKISGSLFGAILRGTDPEAILDAVAVVQELLPSEGYAVGQWSIADAAVTPFFARAEATIQHDIGQYEVGKGKATWEKLQNDPKYERFRRYFEDLKSRDSFKESFDADYIKEAFAKRFSRDRVPQHPL